jgi:hypothetical protein
MTLRESIPDVLRELAPEATPAQIVKSNTAIAKLIATMLVAEGITIGTAVVMLGWAANTGPSWVRRDPELAKAIEESRETGRAMFLAQLWTIAKAGGRGTNSALAILAKVLIPEMSTSKVEHTVAIPDRDQVLAKLRGVLNKGRPVEDDED